MNIRVDLTTPITDGTEVVFRSPVDCSQITGLIVYYDGDSKEFALADAHGNNVGDIDHLFAENVVVKVILDVTHSMAYVQNADTNAYLEGRFKELESKIDQGGGGASLTVTVTEDTDGAYTADLYSGQLYEAHNNGIILFCKYNGKNLPLIVASKAQVVFEGIYTGTLYKVTVGVNRVDVTSTPLATEVVRYTPQDLTPEQQAQALANLGLDELPTGGSDKWRLAIDFTVETEATTQLIFTTDDDGNPLNFRECYFVWNNPPASVVSDIRFSLDDETSKRISWVCGRLSMPNDTTSTTSFIRRLGDRVYNLSGQRYSSGQMQTHLQTAMYDIGNITKIIFSGDGRPTLAVGATFQLYVKE